jgi:hypothetical protein
MYIFLCTIILIQAVERGSKDWTTISTLSLGISTVIGAPLAATVGLIQEVRHGFPTDNRKILTSESEIA